MTAPRWKRRTPASSRPDEWSGCEDWSFSAPWSGLSMVEYGPSAWGLDVTAVTPSNGLPVDAVPMQFGDDARFRRLMPALRLFGRRDILRRDLGCVGGCRYGRLALRRRLRVDHRGPLDIVRRFRRQCLGRLGVDRIGVDRFGFNGFGRLVA